MNSFFNDYDDLFFNAYNNHRHFDDFFCPSYFLKSIIPYEDEESANNIANTKSKHVSKTIPISGSKKIDINQEKADGKENKPTDTKVEDNQSNENKSENKPINTKVEDNQSMDTKVEDNKHTDTKVEDNQSMDTKVEDNKHTDTKVEDNQSSENKPMDTKVEDSKPMDTKVEDTKPTDTKPIEQKKEEKSQEDGEQQKNLKGDQKVNNVKHTKKSSKRHNNSLLTKNISDNYMMINPFSGFGRLDIKESKKNYIVTIDLPGVCKEDIDVDCEDKVLTIQCQRDDHTIDNNDMDYRYVERSFGSFKRNIQLPDDVNEDSIIAELNNGILHIIIAKSDPKEKQMKKISVN
ncbi:hypothetical protein WA158_000011 [Blastocystis sp. Blastoise]